MGNVPLWPGSGTGAASVAETRAARAIMRAEKRMIGNYSNKQNGLNDVWYVEKGRVKVAWARPRSEQVLRALVAPLPSCADVLTTALHDAADGKISSNRRALGCPADQNGVACALSGLVIGRRALAAQGTRCRT
jgi:hypothetical protein